MTAQFPPRFLNEFLAVARSAAARELSVVMRLPVITSQFFSSADVSLGIEFHSSIGNADKQVWIAGMVNELEGAAANAAVDGLARVQFHDRDSFQSARAFRGFPHGDELSREFPHFPSGADRAAGE